jgi:threonine dehydrogenase-like Zn-dependent dehydrogenase
MKSARISQFGSLDVITIAETECPAPGPGQVLVRVKAAGVGPWDALVREGKTGISQSLPLTLGSDISGIIEAVGPEVNEFEAVGSPREVEAPEINAHVVSEFDTQLSLCGPFWGKRLRTALHVFSHEIIAVPAPPCLGIQAALDFVSRLIAFSRGLVESS